MTKIHSVLSRYRLLTSVLALALALGALAATPAAADIGALGGDWSCQYMGCINWDHNVCTAAQECCVNTDGRYYCYLVF